MFYNWGEIANLENEFTNIDNIKNIKIASAYFSNYGLEILKDLIKKNNLKKGNVEIFLSPEFSYENPGKILEALNKIAKVYIVDNMTFHAKVYFLETLSEKKLIFGSSNFTKGGIKLNLEFNQVSVLKEKSQIDSIKRFYIYCKDYSTELNKEIIDNYNKATEDMKKLLIQRENIQKIIFKNVRKDDPKEIPSKEILEGYYFNYKDYETFFDRNTPKSNKELNYYREQVKEKLLLIHENIYSEVKVLKLNCHWRKDNITSSIHPSVYNHNSVDWLGVRYGKLENEISALNYGITNDEKGLGFQKHACIQFCLTSLGYHLNLFHAVPHEALDRDFLHEKIEKNQNGFNKKLITEIEKLKGHNLTWHTNNEEFKFDQLDSKDFLDFYIKNDFEGNYSQLSYELDWDDEKLKSLESISKMTVEMICLLIPLYNLISWRNLN